MRQIILDTETTGLDPTLGHRIVEVAAVEMVNRRLTGQYVHHYLNPGRSSDPGALEIHGLTDDFLADKPHFEEIAAELLEFIAGAELLIHNAPFDVGFLNLELELAGRLPITQSCTVQDTLRMAKDLHPGKKNNLDALCERYQVDRSARTQHSALLDAKLLAEVYLAMTRGQESLLMDLEAPAAADRESRPLPRNLVVLRATAEELAAHQEQLQALNQASKGACVWNALAADSPTQP